MTLSIGELHKLPVAEQGIAHVHNGGSSDHGETVGLLQTVPASPAASETNTAPTAQRESSASLVLGLLLYAACTVCSSGMSILAKLAHGRGIPVMEIVFVRSVMVASIAWISAVHSSQSGGSLLSTSHGSGYHRPSVWGNRRWLLLLRGLLGFGAGSTLYWTVVLLPISDGLVLTSFAPLLVALLSPILIKEVPSRTVLAGIPFCIAGVVMIARPPLLFGGAGIRTLGVAVAIAQCLFSALVKILVRELRTTEQTSTIVFYLGFVSSIGAAVGCALGGIAAPSDIPAFLALFGTGIAGYGSQVTMTMALRRVKAAPATAMSYLSVVWGIIAGIVVFHESLQLWSIAGALLICGSTLTVALLEQRRVAHSEAVRRGLAGVAASGSHEPERTIMLAAPTTHLSPRAASGGPATV